MSFLANVNSRSRSLYMLSPVRLSVVCSVGAPYSAGWNFRQFFLGFWYLGHPLKATKNFMEIAPGKPLRRKIQTQEGYRNIAIFHLWNAVSPKRCKILGKLVLITNRKSYTSFRLVPKVGDLEWPWTAKWPLFSVILPNLVIAFI